MRYCPGCNQWFRRESAWEICPDCGGDLQTPAEKDLEPTMLLGEESGDPINDELVEGGDPLLGRSLHIYECQSFLGEGGMGRVYLARHRDLQRPCALKILPPASASRDPDYIQRFQQEGQAAASLVHSRIITTHALGEADGYHFLEMEYLPGGSLQRRIAAEGCLSPLRATVLAAEIAEGLAIAHRQRVIHRDLKPANVLLTAEDHPKIADFGLAKRILTDEGYPSEQLLGTPHFMAPELFAGQPATACSDVYALGVCYFVLLTGRRPFPARRLNDLIHAATHEGISKILEEHMEIPASFADSLVQLTARDPAGRPADGREAARLLHATLGEVRDLESLLSEAFRGATDVSWRRNEVGFGLELELPDRRRQTVILEPTGAEPPEQLLLIYSTCCRTDPAYYERALRLNAEVRHGGLSVREIDGVPHFVMIDTYPRSTVDAEEIHRSVREVAQQADAVEKRLTGLDRH